VLSPPEGLPEPVLGSALEREWGVRAVSLAYRPVGFGSHHWEVVDTRGTRWFVTVDELERKRWTRHEPPGATFARLRAALTAARDLRDHGHAFVVAPVAALDGEPLARTGDRFAVALYPFVVGRSFSWGEFASPDHRRAVVDLVIAVHTAPEAARRHAPVDDFTIAHRDELEAALDPTGEVEEHGPYTRPMAALLRTHATPVRRLLDRYDRLLAGACAGPGRTVLTHGEPHPGNTMLASGGWRLIDWDTALVAPPERDLWDLDPGDGSVLGAYRDATGTAPVPAMLELYRIRWDLSDLAVDVSRFRRYHPGNPDDDKSWHIMRQLVESLSG
jgi:spectinomycin phosphotransferase/16S rRNA (guanine(1405)-N(7))-methyltransferase